MVRSALLAIIYLGISGCATVYSECVGYEKGTEALEQCQEIAAEYDRVNYLEAVFKPQRLSCEAQGGHSQWNHRGAPSVRVRQALRTGNYDGLTKTDMGGWSCCLGPGICGLF